jgi:hypothetical protein
VGRAVRPPNGPAEGPAKVEAGVTLSGVPGLCHKACYPARSMFAMPGLEDPHGPGRTLSVMAGAVCCYPDSAPIGLRRHAGRSS